MPTLEAILATRHRQQKSHVQEMLEAMQFEDGVSKKRIKRALRFLSSAEMRNCPFIPRPSSADELRELFPAIEEAMRQYERMMVAMACHGENSKQFVAAIEDIMHAMRKQLVLLGGKWRFTSKGILRVQEEWQSQN